MSAEGLVLGLGGLNIRLLEEAAQNLDTVGERLYESSLMAISERDRKDKLERRARMMRLARELRKEIT